MSANVRRIRPVKSDPVEPLRERSEAATGPLRLLLTPPEAAAALAVSERTLWALTYPRGPIPVVRIPDTRTVRYSMAALQEFIQTAQEGGRS
jgi:hypothetical protein